MINEICEEYGIRFNKKEKQKFQRYLRKCGYAITLDKYIGGVCNIIIGDLEKSSIIIFAHYDTPMYIPFLNHKSSGGTIIRPYLLPLCILLEISITLIFLCCLISDMRIYSVIVLMIFVLFRVILFNKNPKNYNDNSSGVIGALKCYEKLTGCCIVFTDFEEYGLYGSYLFEKRYRRILNDKKLYNLDCIGVGTKFLVIPPNNAEFEKHISDYLSFKNYNISHICGIDGYNNIHTPKDCEKLNEELIDNIVYFICNNQNIQKQQTVSQDVIK